MSSSAGDGLARLAAPAVALTAVAALPLFLVGALSVQIRAEIGLAEAHIGALVAVFFGTSALVGGPVRRTIESLGERRSGLITCLLVALGLGIIAGLARSFAGLAAGMAVAGVGQAFGQPAVNGLISRGMRPARRGLIFGIKQMAIPLASLVAGLSVPLLAIPWGWQPVYVIGVVLCLLAPLLVPRSEGPRAPVRLATERPPPGVRRLAISAALAAAATMVLASYLVETLVANGHSPGRAGSLLALAGLVSAAVRLLTGLSADHFDHSPTALARGLMWLGAPALILLPLSGDSVVLAAMAASLAYGLGWGWPPLLDLAVVEIGAQSPAASSSTMLSGAFTGAAIGPLIFGLLVTTVGYTVAWGMATGVLFAAGLVVGRAQAPTSA